MRRRLTRFLALDAPDRRIAVRAFLWILGIDLALRVLGFQRVARGVPSARQGRAPISASEVARARRYAHWLTVIGQNHFARARCLQRAIALQYWLRREGIPGELWIGVRKEGGALLGHAWVTLHGQVVTDAPEEIAQFSPLVRTRGDASAVPSLPSRSRTMVGSPWWR